jgi:MFS transporter, FSR family, fosmidomycin resistance protein
MSDVVSVLVEPVVALLADAGHRRRAVLVGGAIFIIALVAFAAAPSFLPLLLASATLYPASGAFIGLAQATWMDIAPASTERNMARWVVAGSVGNVAGPLLLGAAVAVGFGWRAATIVAAALAVPVLVAARRLRFPAPHPEITDLRSAVRGALAALRSRSVLRWLALLELTDLLGDILLGFLALYLVDVAGASPGAAAAGVAVLAFSSVIGDALLIPALGRIDGARILRWSAAATLVAYPAFLIAGPVASKIVLLVPLGMLTAGWYAIPKGRLYAELPARGGTAVAIGAPADLVGSLLPLAIGGVAARVGLDAAMWLLLGAPLALLLLLPRRNGSGQTACQASTT